MKNYIYADNAATTRLSDKAFEAMIPWLTEEYGNASQLYSFASKPKKAISEARAIIAECIGAEPDEIYFTSGGTEGDNWAVKGSAFSDLARKQIITSKLEHHAVLHSCRAVEMLGYPVLYLSPESDGTVSPSALEEAINDKTRLVSVMTANNEIGTVQPTGELCRVAHSHGALFHTDAVQAVGHIKINVRDMGADMLSASAHKFNGPKGIGFMYIRRGTDILPYADGGAQERGHRAGTENTAAIVGMAAALSENCEQLDRNRAYIKELECLLMGRLSQSNISFIRNGGADSLPGLISLSFADKDGEAILHRMDLRGICISTGSACNSVSTEVSHVLSAIGLDDAYAYGTVRISFGKNNTPDEAVRIADTLADILKK